MIVYDGVSGIYWFYHGWKTAEEMRADPEFSGIFDGPALLYDNGAGKVYDWEPLADVCARWCVPLGPGVDLALDKVKGIAAGGFSDPSDVATEAKEVADEAKATADEAKGAVSDATSAAQTASEAAATAQTTADEAKELADTAAAGMNEYMDALLGLGTTDETEATDAE